MKAYVFVCSRSVNGTEYIFSQVYPTYDEAWEAAFFFHESYNVSQIMEVEV